MYDISPSAWQEPSLHLAADALAELTVSKHFVNFEALLLAALVLCKDLFGVWDTVHKVCRHPQTLSTIALRDQKAAKQAAASPSSAQGRDATSWHEERRQAWECHSWGPSRPEY